ncbi:50S ribosomal protein L10 [Candidatus Woesearchaeota archaeon]|nr:50S ribosomal protein L10 [Candidatus Woesearchaeota archaeon]
MTKTVYVSKKKKDEVSKITKLLKEKPIFGVVNLENMPTRQFQKIRQQLKGTVQIYTTKKRLIKLALDNVSENVRDVDSLKAKIKGMPALILTSENPFKVFKRLEANKSSALAKAGQVSPNDILIPAGPTPFPPGPIIGELGQLGFKTGVENGKVAIKQDKILVKEGEIITLNVANLLAKLKIEPMEIGLNLMFIYEDGLVYTKDVLKVDQKEYIRNIQLASQQAIGLAMEAEYMANGIAELMVQKAYRNAKALAVSINILTEKSEQGGN